MSSSVCLTVPYQYGSLKIYGEDHDELRTNLLAVIKEMYHGLELIKEKIPEKLDR